jgi:hypothetical protein
MADVQIAVIDTIENEVNVAVPGVQGPIGLTGSVAIAQDGTATEPGIRFESDTNTGIYRPGADQLAISTGGTERMRLDSSGRLGIGTSSPAGELHVAGFGNTNLRISSSFSNSTETRLEINTVGDSSIPKIYFLKSGVFRGGFYYNHAATGVAERIDCVVAGGANLSILGSGRVGIGTTSPGSALEINAAAATSPFIAKINTSEVARIDSSGRLLVGTSSYAQTNTYTTDNKFIISGGAGAGPQFATYSADQFAQGIDFAKSRSASVGTNTIVQDGDALGSVIFNGYDGAAYKQAAVITALVDGTPGTNDMPGRLVFSVTADGSASPTEALRISSNRAITVSDGGNVVLGTTTGTKIGTATSQKIGFYNATPVVKPTAVADATDAASVITQLNALLTRMRNLGLIAT